MKNGMQVEDEAVEILIARVERIFSIFGPESVGNARQNTASKEVSKNQAPSTSSAGACFISASYLR